jgi:hypothetical protein
MKKGLIAVSNSSHRNQRDFPKLSFVFKKKKDFPIICKPFLIWNRKWLQICNLLLATQVFPLLFFKKKEKQYACITVITTNTSVISGSWTQATNMSFLLSSVLPKKCDCVKFSLIYIFGREFCINIFFSWTAIYIFEPH